MNCKNCDNLFEGNYCSECGQKRIDTRFTLRALLKQVFHIITNVERGMWFTIGQLAIKPHVVIQDYLNGKSQTYFNPFRFLVLVSTLVALATVQFHVLDTQAHMANPDIDKGSPIVKMMLEQMGKYFNIMVIFSIPFYTFFSWLFLRKKGHSAGEHLIINTYLVSERQLFYAILTPISFFFPSWQGTVFLFFTIVAWGYYGWALKNIYRLKSETAVGISIAVNFLATLIYMIVVMVILAIILVVQVKFFGLEINPKG